MQPLFSFLSELFNKINLIKKKFSFLKAGISSQTSLTALVYIKNKYLNLEFPKYTAPRNF